MHFLYRRGRGMHFRAEKKKSRFKRQGMNQEMRGGNNMAEIAAFLIGMIVGGCAGVLVAALAVAAGKDDHQCW